MGEWETSSHKNFPKTPKNNLTITRQDMTALVYFFSRKQGREGGDVKHSLAGYLSPPAINGYQAAIMGGGIWDTYTRYGPNKQSIQRYKNKQTIRGDEVYGTYTRYGPNKQSLPLTSCYTFVVSILMFLSSF